MSKTDLRILDSLDENDGSSTSWLSSELDLSESALSQQVTQLRGLGLIARHRNEDGDLMLYLTPKGNKALEKSEAESNPKVVRRMPNLKISDKDLADDIKEIADEEGKSITEFLGDLLDESYPVVEEEEEEEEEER